MYLLCIDNIGITEQTVEILVCFLSFEVLQRNRASPVLFPHQRALQPPLQPPWTRRIPIPTPLARSVSRILACTMLRQASRLTESCQTTQCLTVSILSPRYPVTYLVTMPLCHSSFKRGHLWCHISVPIQCTCEQDLANSLPGSAINELFNKYLATLDVTF